MAKTILFLVYAGVQPIDLAGPLQAFTTADEEVGGNLYKVRIGALRAGTVRLAGGLSIVAASLPRRAPHTLIIPGGPGVHEARLDTHVLMSIKRLSRNSCRVSSVCTGAFLLASAGLLNGREAATHWRSCSRLAAEFPLVSVRPDPIWIRDGAVWTSAGVTAGIDLALALIEEDAGAAIALRVARRLVVPLRRAGGQSQHSDTLAIQSVDQFGPLLEWIGMNLSRPLTVEELAERASMAPRTFHRRFLTRVGVTPAQAIERLRLDRARSLLETTRLALSAVAKQTGFGSDERLRRAFYRHFKVSPRSYRNDSADRR